MRKVLWKNGEKHGIETWYSLNGEVSREIIHSGANFEDANVIGINFSGRKKC